VQANPLRTRVSQGECAKGSRGRRLAASLSFIWEVVRIHPTKKPKSRAERFELVGKASTVVRVFHVDDEGTLRDELAMWKTEIGDAESPGCHFHVHILGESDDPPFPVDPSDHFVAIAILTNISANSQSIGGCLDIFRLCDAGHRPEIAPSQRFHRNRSRKETGNIAVGSRPIRRR
jgi:hypothetical protein